MSKHLAVLEGAGLVATVRRGREKLHYLNPVPIHEIYERWISRYEQGRLEALSNLKAATEEEAILAEREHFTELVKPAGDRPAAGPELTTGPENSARISGPARQ